VTTRTVGVEEELLLVDAVDGHPTPVSDEVVAEALIRSGLTIQHGERWAVGHEFKREQTEIASKPCTSMDTLREQLRRLRADVAEAAEARGVLVAALATSPMRVHATTTADTRYEVMSREFGLIASQQLTCGQHVHVSIGSREEGVAVLNRIRSWLSVITALSANSPFWQGEDTGYASYRSVVWGQWPTAGPTEVFDDVTSYDQAVHDLLTSGTTLDDGMIYFDARLSARYPTVEIRVSDVCTDLDDAVLVAALCRALVDTAAEEWRAGIPAPDIRVGLLRAATWRAARAGISGDLVDARLGRPVPAWALINKLLAHLDDSLRNYGDDEVVRSALDRLRERGTGADRQRASFERRNVLHDVVKDAVSRTTGNRSNGGLSK
jgi:carboxylate-amine ligase